MGDGLLSHRGSVVWVGVGVWIGSRGPCSKYWIRAWSRAMVGARRISGMGIGDRGGVTGWLLLVRAGRSVYGVR